MKFYLTITGETFDSKKTLTQVIEIGDIRETVEVLTRLFIRYTAVITLKHIEDKK